MTLRVVLVKSEEIEVLERQVSELQDQVKQLQRDIAAMQQYADLSLTLMDQLRQARSLLRLAGLDTSFITTLR